MKYNEKDLTEFIKNEKTIWSVDDLNWFDNELVVKLQNNQLPIEEKNKLIEMMANDQAVMNRYLELKQQTAPVKESIVDRFLSPFISLKPIPLLATGFALLISIVIIFNQKNEHKSFESDPVRGIPQASIYPLENSHLKTAPEFFIVNNQSSQLLGLQLYIDNKTIWVSEFQRSTKFYLPEQVQQKLTPGNYSWSVMDNNKQVIINNKFTIN